MFLCKYLINIKFDDFVHVQWGKGPMGYLAFMHSSWPVSSVLLIFKNRQTHASILIIFSSVSQ